MSTFATIKDLTGKSDDFKKLFISPDIGYYRERVLNQQKPVFEFFTQLREDDKIKYIFVPRNFGVNVLKLTPFPLKNYATIDAKFSGELRDYQIEVSEKALKYLNKDNGVILHCSPGFGKTITAVYLATKLNCYTIVICDNLVVHRSWEESFSRFSDVSAYLVTTRKLPATQPKVIVCTSTTIMKLPEEWKLNVGTLILDESHSLCCKSAIPGLLSTVPHYIIACSGTPNRPDKLEIMTHYLTGDNVIEAERPCEPTCFKVITKFKPEGNPLDHKSYLDFLKSLRGQEERKIWIINFLMFVGGVWKEGGKRETCIVFFDNQKDVEWCNKQLQKLKLGSDTMYGTQTEYQQEQFLIGTYQKIGQGFDQATYCKKWNGVHFKNVVILFTSKQENLINQCINRSRDYSPKYWFIIDSHKKFESHYKEMIKGCPSKTKFLTMGAEQTDALIEAKVNKVEKI